MSTPVETGMAVIVYNRYPITTKVVCFIPTHGGKYRYSKQLYVIKLMFELRQICSIRLI